MRDVLRSCIVLLDTLLWKRISAGMKPTFSRIFIDIENVVIMVSVLSLENVAEPPVVSKAPGDKIGTMSQILFVASE